MDERERACLVYLSDKMEASALSIGQHLIAKFGVVRGASNYKSLGAAMMGRLRKRGLVTRLSDLNAWRITKAGRTFLGESK